MVYRMRIFACGRCRYTGAENAIAAASIVYVYPNRPIAERTWPISTDYPHIRERAELASLVSALIYALERMAGLQPGIRADVRIYSDSNFVGDCMNRFDQLRNQYAATEELGQRVCEALVNELISLDNRIRAAASLRYVRVPVGGNSPAERFCYEFLDGGGQHVIASQVYEPQWRLEN